jgi:hypothetical protein
MASAKKVTKATRAAEAAKSTKATKPAKAPAVVKAPANASEPVWVKPQVKGKKLGILMPDGGLLAARDAEPVVLWPSVRLRVVFDPWAAWVKCRDTPWHDSAVERALKLAELVSPTFMVQDLSDRLSEAVLSPIPYGKAKAEAAIEKTLFLDAKTHLPWTVLRTGLDLGVTYDRSLLVRNDSLSLFLPPTPANAALLTKTLDALVGGGGLPFSHAGVGFAVAGWASALAVDRAARDEPGTYRANKLERLESKDAVLGAEWLVWIGERLRAPDTTGKLLAPVLSGAGRKVVDEAPLARVEVSRPTSPDDAAGAKAARALADDLAAALKKVRAKLTATLLREDEARSRRGAR